MRTVHNSVICHMSYVTCIYDNKFWEDAHCTWDMDMGVLIELGTGTVLSTVLVHLISSEMNTVCMFRESTNQQNRVYPELRTLASILEHDINAIINVIIVNHVLQRFRKLERLTRTATTRKTTTTITEHCSRGTSYLYCDCDDDNLPSRL